MSYTPISESSVDERTLEGSAGPQADADRGRPDGTAPAARAEKAPLPPGWPTAAQTLRSDSILSMWLPSCAWGAITALLPMGFIGEEAASTTTAYQQQSQFPHDTNSEEPNSAWHTSPPP